MTFNMGEALMCLIFFLIDCQFSGQSSIYNERQLQHNLEQLDTEYRFMMWMLQTLEWNYAINMTTETGLAKDKFETTFNQWMSGWKHWAKHLSSRPRNSIFRRIINTVALGVIFPSPEMAKIASELKTAMAAIYAKGRVKLDFFKRKFTGEYEVSIAMSEIRNPKILKRLWRQWRYIVGNEIKPYFLRLVSLLNAAAVANGYDDIGEVWRSELSMQTVVKTAHGLWHEVADFYFHIHAFVRRRLVSIYGSDQIDDEGPIPVHLLGSLWGDSWDSLGNAVLPYPDVTVPDVTETMIKRNMTVDDMVRLSETFYTSMGMFPMTSSFWNYSIFTKPNDMREIDCHGAAFDFSIYDDFRIKICANVSARDLRTVIHEMGHIEYFMAYRSQPMIFRSGANSAFHEAIGETIVYSSFSHRCLQRVGLWEGNQLTKEQELNMLMQRALSKVVFLPWSLLIDLWRYEVFRGKLSSGNMTRRWWQMRYYYQGVIPPSEEDIEEFDPGSKYHIANNVPYMRYYFSRFLEHQIHESLCSISESQNEPLHHCCLYGAKQAGSLLRQALSLGSSRRWQDVLNIITGDEEIKAEPLLRYYKPLYDWLKKENAENDVKVGWM